LFRLQQLNFDVGIYTISWSWSPIVGLNFTDFSNLKLWWPQYDGVLDNHNFHSFGGWTAPAIKQFSGDYHEDHCGLYIDQNYKN
jgi:hypothetical protein